MVLIERTYARFTLRSLLRGNHPFGRDSARPIIKHKLPMKLDYNPSGGYYLIRVPRSESMAISQMMTEHGLSFSQSASTANEAVLFTKEPYAACWFAGDATPRAIKELGPILSAVNASWKAESNAHIKCPMDEELWPFQRADVEYALQRNNTLVG
jgi:hypothetical protein